MIETDKTVRLSDGRTLSYTECGDPAGAPVFFLHGTPGSRLLGTGLHPDAVSCKVRLISPDRPGYGNSTFRRSSLVEYVNDLVQLADALALGHAREALGDRRCASGRERTAARNANNSKAPKCQRIGELHKVVHVFDE